MFYNNFDNPKEYLCADVIAPEGYGEIFGGSEREGNYEILKQQIEEAGLNLEDYQWYLDLRKFGGVPHSGFGMGFERTIAWICKLDHIREAIPFPRLINRMQPVIDELKEKGLLHESRGAQVVDMGEGENPAIIVKSDGTSIYLTRDLAAAEWRMKEYNFVKMLYVVGNEQAQHFVELKTVLKKMGYDWADEIHHVPFGLITQGGKKLSTRKGNVVFLDQVLKDAVSLAKKQIQEKNPDLADQDQVAHDVGVGAVVFHDLKNDRLDNFDFDLEEVVRFEGDTGPYVQYTNARAQSVLRKAAAMGENPSETDLALDDDWAFAVAKDLADFPRIVARSAEKFEPSVIAKFALDLAKKFNKYYANVKILTKDDKIGARLALVQATSIVLMESLRLLGVNAPKEM